MEQDNPYHSDEMMKIKMAERQKKRVEQRKEMVGRRTTTRRE